MTFLLAKKGATWLTSPNQPRMSEIVFGIGKSLMLSRIFGDGFTSSIVISKPANSTCSLAKQNFFWLNTIPFLEQCVK